MNKENLYSKLSSAQAVKEKRIGRFLSEEFSKLSSSQPPTAVAYFKSRWGEVDGYLPVLHKFKETHPEWRIIAIIGSERMSNTVEAQSFLYNELKETVDVLIRLNTREQRSTNLIFYRKWLRKLASWYHRKCVHISWRKVFDYLNKQKIELIFKDHGRDDKFLLKLQSMTPAKCVSSPHGTGIYYQDENTQHLKAQNARLDLFLAGDESELPIFRIFTGEQNASKIQVVGRPRYDRWWIEHLCELPCLKLSQEYQLTQNSERMFLFATRGSSSNSSFFPKSVFEYLVTTVAETVLSQPGNLLIIKPHPQQDLGFIKETMAKYDADSWRISFLHTMQLAHISDFVICMLSSVILDALAVGKPTVEYFQFTKRLHCFPKDESGRTISVYNHLGLITAAENQEELEELIQGYFNGDNRTACWDEQRKQTKEFMKLDNQSSARAVAAIDQILELQQTA